MTTLEKIRAEIEQIKPYELPCDKRTPEHIKDMELEIIDRYAEQEPCENCCNGDQIEKARLCQKSYLAGMEHKQEPCDDVVSRQAVLDIVNNPLNIRLDEIIKKLPPVNPQEQTGHWIAQDIHNCHTDFKCSECGYIHSFMHLYGEPTAYYTYCPNCGARMESEDKE